MLRWSPRPRRSVLCQPLLADHGPQRELRIPGWGQSIPGLGNRARNADGTAMKHWWPLLFY
jgi:hypothetical protein